MRGPTLPISMSTHALKYRLENENFEQAMKRVANALKDDQPHFKAFRDIVMDMRFLPPGRVQSAMGSPREVTAFNCLSGDTEILTREYGAVPIREVAGKIVTLLDGNGDWVKCPVYDHGEQTTYVLHFSGGFNGVDIRSTLEHGWIQGAKAIRTKAFTHEKGRVEIDGLIPSKDIIDQEQYRAGIEHGIIYGDGWENDGHYTLRLCGEKVELLDFLRPDNTTQPPSVGDDVMCYYHKGGRTSFKTLPETSDLCYLRGFMRGWLATDGCVSTQPHATICCGPDEESWIRKWAPLIGWQVGGSSLLATTTNYGERNKASRNLILRTAWMSSDDFLREKHRARWESGSTKTGTDWRIRGCYHTPRVEHVYCPVVPTTHSFALACGIHSSNCFVSGPIEDTFVDGEGSIMGRATEAAQTMRLGGGIGYSFSTLRPRGDIIKSLDSASSGAVSFMNIFDAVCGCVSSAGHRRGAQMGVLRVDHPDIVEFVNAKARPGAFLNFNFSVGITHKFIECLENNKPFPLTFGGKVYREIDAAMLWNQIMLNTWDWAEPGVLFIDTMNDMNNLWYCETIAATNPCLVEGTLVSTPSGLVPVEAVKVGDLVCTVDAPGAVQTIETHENIPVFEVKFSDGSILKATGDHIFHTKNKAGDKYWYNDVRLKDVKVGTQVRVVPTQCPNNHVLTKPSAITDRDFGLMIGAILGDGCYTKNTTQLKISVSKCENGWADTLTRLFNKYGFTTSLLDSGTANVINVSSTFRKLLDTTLLQKCKALDKHIPIEWINSNRDFILGVVDGMISTDGNIHVSKNNPMIRIASGSFDLCTGLKRMFSMLGIHARIYGYKRKPHKIGGREINMNNTAYTVVLLGDACKTLAKQLDLSHPDKQARLKDLVLNFQLTGEMWATTIKNITPAGTATVYDLYEPITDTWITEGICNRGCGEQPLPPFGACLLGSFNLVKYVTKDRSFDYTQLIADIPHVVRAMDNVIDRTLYPLPQQGREARAKRRMGLGVTGLANAIEAMGYAYGSEKFTDTQAHILATIRNYTYMASAELAAEKGAFALFNADKYLDGKFIKTLPEGVLSEIKKNGIRNSHLTSIAPTGTISLCADNVSSGIEPVFSYAFTRDIITSEGKTTEVVEDYGVRVFGVEGKKSDDVTMDEHLNVLITAQRYVDSAVSKTCNVPGTVNFDAFQKIYLDAYHGGAKGCTTFRKDGKRMGILRDKDEDEEVVEGTACTIDPDTGAKSCGD